MEAYTLENEQKYIAYSTITGQVFHWDSQDLETYFAIKNAKLFKFEKRTRAKVRKQVEDIKEVMSIRPFILLIDNSKYNKTSGSLLIKLA